MNTRPLTLEEIKHTEIEILNYTVDICKKHNIRYFLIYGTLLGAVRHKGFIPWDDDIDIYMPRPDYERFLKIWKNEIAQSSPDFRLFIPGESPDYYYEYAKIAAAYTTCNINIPIKDIPGMGIWIDVFPLDGMPDKYKSYFYKLHYMRQMRSLSVYTKVPPIRSIKSLAIYIGWKIVRIIGWKFFNKKVIKLASKYDYNTSKYLACTTLASKIKYVYPREYFEQTTQLEFEGQKYNVPKGYHQILTQTYGNYMEYPPVEQRVSLHSFDAYYL